LRAAPTTSNAPIVAFLRTVRRHSGNAADSLRGGRLNAMIVAVEMYPEDVLWQVPSVIDKVIEQSCSLTVLPADDPCHSFTDLLDGAGHR
jgi:hypothetical protein